MPPIRLSGFPFGPICASPGETVLLEDEASPARCACNCASYDSDACELGYDPGPDMSGAEVSGVGGGDGRFVDGGPYDWGGG